jgi:hypothetical protein
MHALEGRVCLILAVAAQVVWASSPQVDRSTLNVFDALPHMQ